MTDIIRLDNDVNDEKYQLMNRIVNTKTKEVVKEWRESCMFPNSKPVIRNAARKNGCYKVGKDLIRHSYAKLLIEDRPVQLDNNADHEISDCGTSGTVYIAMPNDVSVEIYFETDARQNINLLSVGDTYKLNGIDISEHQYTLQDDHKQPIKAIIDKYLYDNPVDDSEYQDYDTAASLGFSHSDWLYA